MQIGKPATAVGRQTVFQVGKMAPFSGRDPRRRSQTHLQTQTGQSVFRTRGHRTRAVHLVQVPRRHGKRHPGRNGADRIRVAGRGR